jgi:hypothetical protein
LLCPNDLSSPPPSPSPQGRTSGSVESEGRGKERSKGWGRSPPPSLRMIPPPPDSLPQMVFWRLQGVPPLRFGMLREGKGGGGKVLPGQDIMEASPVATYNRSAEHPRA